MKVQVARAGAAVMIVKDGKVLLGKRHDDPEKAGSQLHGEGTWTLPGGKVDFGETIFEYKSNSYGAKDYLNLCREIVKRG